ncbi:transporter substrate-binding protein [Affinibrenneria salicis]|uniref:Transporter substrate-binding protein n=1 Tax=Affinibrenneria salicis TaxID=2590031 RepID=A0A5J5FZL8_9GAMM|nr:transporter substrate-binding protein [Affinibrenneria salicis]KAA8999374.1 transporter substrate-binding protein [Affinibrenneria salicis]
MRSNIDVGILFSTDGTYRYMAESALAGTQHALAEINADPRYDFSLRASHINPGGSLSSYGEGMEQLTGAGVRHIFGTITSASRKEIIPDLEQHDALLWYASPYEGFESSEQVIYLGGCPNQTLLPLLRLALSSFGRRAYLVGSNYVWGWESNRIAREAIGIAGGEVLGEKYLHLGHTVVEDLVNNVIASAPEFVLNNLVGESSYAFLRRLDARCAASGIDLPVLSCNLTEAELSQIGQPQALRLLSCGPFFAGVEPLFCARQRRKYGWRHYSHYYTGAWLAMMLFADAVRQAGSADPQRVREALHAGARQTPLGPLRISAQNNHSWLPCHIAELRDGAFLLLHSESQPVAPDPYLTATDLRAVFAPAVNPTRPVLRIVK